jgi:MFS family permease
MPEIDESSPTYRGWRVVFACFLVAFFIFGFGLYGQGVYLAELQRSLGWSGTLIATASTLSFLISSVLAIFISDLLARYEPRILVLCGVVALTASVVLLAFMSESWQLYVAYILMALGWSGMGTVMVAVVVSSWFKSRRGLAISLAFNGATSGGILLAPLLLLLVGAIGFTRAMLSAAAVMVVVLVPVVLAWVALAPAETAPSPSPHGEASIADAAPLSRLALLREEAFWTVTVPFALALLAQVGFIVHQVAFLEPMLGRHLAGLAVTVTTAMAVAGRLGLGLFVDRVDPRLAGALSFLSQAGALALLLAASNAAALLFACAVYGFSIGNLITLPPLILQREFGRASFGAALGLSSSIGGVVSALGPGILGLVHDATGGYAAALALCLALELIATAIVLLPSYLSAADKKKQLWK